MHMLRNIRRATGSEWIWPPSRIMKSTLESEIVNRPRLFLFKLVYMVCKPVKNIQSCSFLWNVINWKLAIFARQTCSCNLPCFVHGADANDSLWRNFTGVEGQVQEIFPSDHCQIAWINHGRCFFAADIWKEIKMWIQSSCMWSLCVRII